MSVRIVCEFGAFYKAKMQTASVINYIRILLYKENQQIFIDKRKKKRLGLGTWWDVVYSEKTKEEQNKYAVIFLIFPPMFKTCVAQHM